MKTSTAQTELIWDTRSQVTESPIWDPKERLLYFADLHAPKIYAYGVDNGSRKDWLLPEAMGSMGMCASGKILVALVRRVVKFDPRTGKVEEFSEEFRGEKETNKLNDGKIGPDGCFWVGSSAGGALRGPKERSGALYRVTPDGKVEKKSEGYMTCNGLAWTPDGRIMFHSDSRGATIDAWDFDAKTGKIANKRTIATLTDEEGRPDGAACDNEGYYWSAGVSASCLNRFSAKGELVEKAVLPTPGPTMPCFVENSLYITTIRRGREEQVAKHPTLGGVFRMKAPLAGAPIGVFADK